jgi:integrase
MTRQFGVDPQHVRGDSADRQRDGNPIHEYGQGNNSVRHSKEDALNEREFELLLEGAYQLSQSDYYYTPDPPMTIYVLGRLGLRRSELVHLREDWIDFRQQMISIPSHEPCTLGRAGDRPCGDCIQAAKQRVEFADGELSLADALRWMWAPKTEAGARDVYFGHDTRAQMYLERYFESDEYDRYQASGTAVNRRVHKAAELAPELDSETVYPHALRATAATNMIATRDVDVYQLCQVMGWERLATAETYIARNSQKTARQLEGL